MPRVGVGGVVQADRKRVPASPPQCRGEVEEVVIGVVQEDDAALPRPGWPSDREGRVQSVYVVPHARRRGIARTLMAEVMDYARAAMLIRLTLHPSDDARPLYASLGFDQLDEMGLRLTGE